MPSLDRRRFLQLAGGSAALTMLPTSIARAAAIPANRRTGTIRDVEHIVVLMQENRSFDHYFGTLRGVRGYGDPHPAVLPSGKSVWHQSDGTSDILPFRPNVDDVGLAFIQDLDHSWDGGHTAFNDGKYDQWVPAKSSTTMAHLERRDMPFHYALADAFTICDDYHCSLLGPTDPNRYYMWTGWVGNDGKGGGPVIANDELGYGWTTYPERLEQAGVSWKIYQDAGAGLDAEHFWGWGSDAYIGNYGDNSLLYFKQFQNAAPGSALFTKAVTGTNVQNGGTFFDDLAADVRANRLPQVSWIVAPEAFTEHPNWPANFGAWYTSQVLDALTSNPEVWSKTALLLTFDENDGFFDHLVPPHPNTPTILGRSTVSTENEIYTTGDVNTPGGSTGVTGPYGMGQRVPMLAISPWSTGGWVCSETFDHTSIIRFIEKRFGVHEPNITPWRRAVAGDLSAAFDFSRTKASVPTLPSTAAYQPKNTERHKDYVPVPPADPAVPSQEAGTRPSRALGYRLDLGTAVEADKLKLTLHNTGSLGAHIQVRSNTLTGAPFSYTVGSGDSLSDAWPVHGAYDASFHGPNGYYRRVAGDGGSHGIEVTLREDRADQDVVVTISNTTGSSVSVSIADAYSSGRPAEARIGAHQSHRSTTSAARTGGWYDVTVTVDGHAAYARQFAGRLETGRHSISDPQLGR